MFILYSCLMSEPELAFELKPLTPEVDQQSNVKTSCGEIVHCLNFVGFDQGLNRFQLQDDFSFHQDVGSEIAYRYTFIKNVDPFFFFGSQARFAQFDQQGLPINRFQEARPRTR